MSDDVLHFDVLGEGSPLLVQYACSGEEVARRSDEEWSRTDWTNSPNLVQCLGCIAWLARDFAHRLPPHLVDELLDHLIGLRGPRATKAGA